MSTVKATYSGFVSHDGIPVMLSAGEEYDADHPLVEARPDLFSKATKPEPKTDPVPKPDPDPDPKPPQESEQPPEPKPATKRGPGRPPGSRNKAKGDG
jgi:periplasmic protein TonB